MASFEQARTLADAGNVSGAREIWTRIAQTKDIESRHVLQAWHHLRGSGARPPKPSRLRFWAPWLRCPSGSEHDVLAAYADGSVRYLNYSGKVAVIDPPGPRGLGRATAEWLAIAGQLSNAIEPWDGALPDVPTGHARVLMLTPSGPRFGQGPYEALSRDAAAGAFLTGAAGVLQIVVRLAT